MSEETKTEENPLPDDAVPVMVWRRGIEAPIRIISDQASWSMLQQRILNDDLKIKGGGNAYILDSPADSNSRRTRFIFTDVVGFAGSELVK